MNTNSDSGNRPAEPAPLPFPTGSHSVRVNDEDRLLRWHYLPWRAAVGRFIATQGYQEEAARATEADWVEAYDRDAQPAEAVLDFLERRGVLIDA